MYFRKKTSGGRAYLQIVESRREGAAVRQQVIATLGRVEDLRESGQLERLLRSGARFAAKAIVVDAAAAGEATTSSARRIGPALAFERLWEETGCRGVIETWPARAIMISRWSARFSSPFCIACFRAALIGRRIAGGWTTGSRASRGSICIIFIARWPGWREKGRGYALRAALPKDVVEEAVRRRRESSARSIWCSWTHQPLLRGGGPDASTPRLFQGSSARSQPDDPGGAARRRADRSVRRCGPETPLTPAADPGGDRRAVLTKRSKDIDEAKACLARRR